MDQNRKTNEKELSFFDSSVLLRIKNEQRLTQQFIADHLKVHQSKVGRWEAGLNIPDANELKALAALFELDVNEFFTNNLPPPSKTK